MDILLCQAADPGPEFESLFSLGRQDSELFLIEIDGVDKKELSAVNVQPSRCFFQRRFARQ
jgi:hypothetical protein